MRLNTSQIKQAQTLADRLYIRESDMYQLAFSFALSKLSNVTGEYYRGVDLLPFLLEMRENINKNLNISKHVLFKIINTSPDEFVEMTDIELLKSPTHLLKHALQQLGEKPLEHDNPETCLKAYFFKKYNL